MPKNTLGNNLLSLTSSNLYKEKKKNTLRNNLLSLISTNLSK